MLLYYYMALTVVVALPLSLAVDGTDWATGFAGWTAGDWCMLLLGGTVLYVGQMSLLNYCAWQLGAPLVSMMFGLRVSAAGRHGGGLAGRDPARDAWCKHASTNSRLVSTHPPLAPNPPLAPCAAAGGLHPAVHADPVHHRHPDEPAGGLGWLRVPPRPARPAPLRCLGGRTAAQLASVPPSPLKSLIPAPLQIAGAVLAVLSVTVYAAHRWYVSRQAAAAPADPSSGGGGRPAAEGVEPSPHGL